MFTTYLTVLQDLPCSAMITFIGKEEGEEKLFLCNLCVTHTHKKNPHYLLEDSLAKDKILCQRIIF